LRALSVPNPATNSRLTTVSILVDYVRIYRRQDVNNALCNTKRPRYIEATLDAYNRA
jgi:hypothetical protein